MYRIDIEKIEEYYFDYILSSVNDSSENANTFVNKEVILEYVKEKYKLNQKDLGIFVDYCIMLSITGKNQESLELIEKTEKSEEYSGISKVKILNAKAFVLNKLNHYEMSNSYFTYALIESRKISYYDGLEFSKYLYEAYKNIDDYLNAIYYLDVYIDFNREKEDINSLVEALLNISEMYLYIFDYDKSLLSLKEVSSYDVLIKNKDYHISFCDKMYITLKNLRRFEEALSYHETYMSLLLLSNNIEDDHIMNLDGHEVLSIELSNTNDMLSNTLKKAHDMQNELLAKNQELEATMEDLNSTQEKLLIAEKHAVLDGMVINIAEHMNTPLGVMNTVTSHVKIMTRQIISKVDNNLLTKTDLNDYLNEMNKSFKLHEESMFKVINFIDAMKNYHVDEDGEPLITLNIKEFLLMKKDYWEKIKGYKDVTILCDDDVCFDVKKSFLDKCIELIVEKITKNTNREGFDFEISEEYNFVTIGIGDFKSEKILDAESNTYDYYIIQTIVEDLMGGRFIKFEDMGREFYQFIFPKYL